MPRRLRRLFRFSSRTSADVRTEIREEFQFHLDMRTRDLIRDGLSEAAARAQALAEFGDRSAGLAGCAQHDARVERRRWIARMAGELRQDTRVGLRLLARSPGFAAVALLTLGLGIGATTAIFSALDAALLRPLPYPAPERMVEVFETHEDGARNSVAGGVFLDWRAHQTRFDSLVLLNRITVNLRQGTGTDRVSGIEASHELLQVLGVRPLLGRGFLPEDDRVGGRTDVVILTEELWRSRFGANPSILGTAIVIDEVPRTVVGIVPAGMWMYREAQLFLPAVLEPNTDRGRRAPHWAVVFGRLKPGTSAEQAQVDLRLVKQQLASEYPAFKRTWSVAVTPLQGLLAQDSRPILFTLVAAVALVLLIACANVANLLLARACNRQQEIALRAALGASGARIVRQVLTESVLLSALGGVIGIAVAYWSVGLLAYLMADMLPQALAPTLDARVLTFAVLISGVTGVVFGLIPALRARRPDLNGALKNGGKSTTAGGRQRTQSTLVIAEVALTVVLLAAAGLVLRSLANTASADPGFEPQRAIALDLSLPDVTYQTGEKRLAFSSELLGRFRALPGVDAAGSGMAIPFAGGGYGEYVRRSDRPKTGDHVLGRVDFISEGYLDALGARVLAGRRFTSSDNRAGGRRVAIINTAAARLFFPSDDPVGRQVSVYDEDWEVVGVIADVVDRRLDLTHSPFFYLPQAFNPSHFSIVVRSRLEPGAVVNSLRDEVKRLDPGVALSNIRTLDDSMSASLTGPRLVFNLIGAFAAIALGLACIGLYGVMAYSVAMRRRELCIRLALGAVRSDLLRHIVGDGMRLMGAGLFIGIVGALAAARLLSTQLYHVRSADPLVATTTIATILAVGFGACWIPAWRATKVDATAALRSE